MAGPSTTISKTSITAYTQPFIAVQVEINYEIELVLLLLCPALLWTRLCSLGQGRWDCLPYLDSPPVAGRRIDLTGHIQRFFTPSCNGIIVHANDPRFSARIYVWGSISVGDSRGRVNGSILWRIFPSLSVFCKEGYLWSCP